MRCENFELCHNNRLLRADPCCRSVIKEFAHAFSCLSFCSWTKLKNLFILSVRISSYGCTWEVWRAFKKLELLSAAPRTTLAHFSCSPNFPRTHAKHEQIRKFRLTTKRQTHRQSNERNSDRQRALDQEKEIEREKQTEK